MEQNQPGILAGRYLAGKRRARARGLSKCGGMQDDTVAAAAPIHREMSLGSHGNDREVDRAQHLFCNRANEHLAEFAPAPCSEQHAIRLKLTDGGCNLMYSLALTYQRVAADAAPGGEFAPGPQHLFRDLQSAGGVVIRHAGGIGVNGRGGGKHVQENSRAAVFTRLLHGERHEMVQIAQVSGDEDCGWMRPAAGLGIPHGKHPMERVSSSGCIAQLSLWNPPEWRVPHAAR